jgi:TPR repeat protein
MRRAGRAPHPFVPARISTVLFLVVGTAACAGARRIDTREQRCVECALRAHPDARALPDAARRFGRLCDAGDEAACSLLGVMSEQGRGVPRDAKRAERLHRRACAGGNQPACVNLGRLLVDGTSGRHDPAAAALLFELACAGGVATGCHALGLIAEREGRSVLAAGWHARACEKGDASGCQALAAMYETGVGVGRDPRAAARLYEQACRGGSSHACSALHRAPPSRLATAQASVWQMRGR